MTPDEKELFDLRRFEKGQNYFFLFLYIPIGFLLLTFRLIIYATIYQLSIPLPRNSIKFNLLKCVRLLFGIFVKDISTNQRQPSSKIIIANHITIMDHFVLDSMFNCKKIDDSSHFSETSQLPDFDVLEYQTAISHIRERIFSSGEVATLIFPEEACTNGKYGLMKFESWPFALSIPIQPIAIRLEQLPLLKISPTVLGAKSWVDLCWFLFRPYSVFVIRVLPVVKNFVASNEEVLSKRAQVLMAHCLDLVPTDCSVTDKKEYERISSLSSNLKTENSSTKARSTDISKYPLHVIEQAKQVKEITPDVPLDVIIPYLEMNGSIYETVKKLFEENIAKSNISDSHVLTEALENLNTSASTFGKTPKIRMASFQDRKNALILAAKIRYLKKLEMSDTRSQT